MNKDVLIKNKSFYIKGRPVFINSGEIHYFRLRASEWEDRLKKAAQAGLNTISTYIPWRWHEPEKGHFCFDGSDKIKERDLKRFIELVKKHKLYFFPRIGPISNAELSREGLPDWLIEDYDELRVKKQDGENLPHPGLPSLMHPLYQKYVSKWYDQIVPFIKNYLFDNDGPIIVIQLDNEIGMVNWCARTADYNIETTKLFRQSMVEKYSDDIGKVNKVCKTSYKSFDDIVQPEGVVNTNQMQLFWDWSEFYREFYAKYYKSLNDRVRGFDIDLPLSANIPQFWDYNMCGRGNQGVMTSTQYKSFSKYSGDVIFGGAYQMRNLNFENFHDTIVMTEMAKMISTPDAPISCAEMQIGGMNDRPRIYPSDIELNLKTTVGHGVNSINGYMFAGGTNRYGLGCRSTYHEWQAPVGSDGEKRIHFDTISQFGKVMKMWGGVIAPCTKISDLCIGFYPAYYETEYMHGDFVESLICARDKFFFDGVVRLLQVAGYNMNFSNIESDSLEVLRKKPVIWVFALEFMPSAIQQKLLDYVNMGGTLVVGPTLPDKAADLSKCRVLEDGFGVKIKDKIHDTIVMFGKKDIFLDGAFPVTVFDVEGKFKKLGDLPGHGVCALEKNIGAGKVVVAGFGVTHFFDYHVSVIDEMAKIAGITKTVETGCYDIHAVVRKNADSGFLFVSNFNDVKKESYLKINANFQNTDKNRRKIIAIAEGKKISIPARSSWILPLNQQIADDLTVVYSTAEIIKISKSQGKKTSARKYKLSLRVPRDCVFHVKLKTSKKVSKVMADGKKLLNCVCKNGIIRIEHCINSEDCKCELDMYAS